MKTGSLIYQVSLGITAAILFDHAVIMLIHGLQISDNLVSVLLAFLSVSALLLGFFKQTKGFSLGLILVGLLCGIQSLYFYQANLTDSLKFSLAIIILMIIVYACYKLHKKQSIQRG